MANTATLPGAGKAFVTITAGADDHTQLQAAINAEFVNAKPNITAATVASGAAGKAGFFNLVFDDAATSKAFTAGTGVQAIIDTGAGTDTLTGSAQTNLIVGGTAGNVINTNLASGVASVFGGDGSDTVNVSGKAQAYLEGGKNVVNLNVATPSACWAPAAPTRSTSPPATIP